MKKTVLNLDHSDAKEYFLSEDSYHNFDLPPYFKFGPLLNKLNIEIDKKDVFACLKEKDKKSS